MKRLKYLLLLLIVLVACGSLPVYGETDAPAPSLEAGQPAGGVVEITDGGATLRADASSGKIWVTDPFGGEWASNPDDPEADPVASGFLKMNLYAQLIVSGTTARRIPPTITSARYGRAASFVNGWKTGCALPLRLKKRDL